MIPADYLTPEHELVHLVRAHASSHTEAEVREACRYRVVYSERDPDDTTPDACDHYTGYGPTYAQAHARAYGQSAAAERHAQSLGGLR